MRPANASPAPADAPLGLLLAAGLGSRFSAAGGAGAKLLAPLRQGPEAGLPLAFVAARRLRAALPRVVAVLRDTDSAAVGAPPTLADWLRRAGCEVMACPESERGMGATLAAAVRAHAAPHGWLVALADMPAIAPATIQALAALLDNPEAIVAPRHAGRRGHPVGFGAAHGAALGALDGERGAAALLERHPVHWLDTLDAGVLYDVDRPEDLDGTAPR